MTHLTEAQLSALADGALGGGERAAAERHLEACEPCREALAALAARDRALRGALEHDPGEAYFEDFAARVGGRIRALGLKGAQARAPEGRSLADWFRAPRKLTAMGALATVVAGAGIVMLVTREVKLPVLRDRAVERRTEVAPPAAQAPGTPAQTPPAPATDAMPPAGAPLASSRDFAPPPAPLASAEKSAPPPAAEREAVAAGAAPAEEAKSATAPRSAPVAANETTPPRGVPMQDTGVEPVARMEKASLAAAEPEAADEFAGQPTYTTLHGRNARRLTALAERMQVAPAWDSAAAEWAALLLGTEGGPLEAETRFQMARARYLAWRAEATGRRATRAREACVGFLEKAPAGARRDSVAVWSAALGE